MAKLQTIAKWSEAKPYLEDKKVTVQRDIVPLLQAEGHAPFTVSRNVTSYLDHLGELYTGSEKVGERFQKYLEQVLAKIDPNYKRRAGEIYEMYRNGTVHEFDPKILENSSGQTLGWFCYYGARTDVVELPGGLKIQVTHLEPVNPDGDGKSWYLPISSRCLIDDLLASISLLENAGPENERITAWNRASRRLETPKAYNFAVP